MNPYRGLSWTDLLARLQATDPRDEAAWHEAQVRLEGYARAALPPALASDPERVSTVAGRALTKLYTAPALLARLADSKAPAGPAAYLAATVYHAATDTLREDARLARRTSPLLDPHAIPDPKRSPHAEWERRESAEELRILLQSQLDPADWDLLRQRFWEDRSIQEIATSLGVAYHTAAMRLHRVQQRLLALLREREDAL